MAVQTAATTTLSLSAAKPATHNAAGFSALTFTEIGEVTDGGNHGRTYQVVPHNPIGSRGTQKFKGSFNEGTKSVQLAIDRDDAGQTLAKTALNSDEPYSFCVEYPDGSKDYFLALVMSFQTQTSGVDSLVTGTMELEITTAKDGSGIIEVDPAP